MSPPFDPSLHPVIAVVPCLPARCNLLGGRLPERPMGADCKSVGLRLHRFESCTCHQRQVVFPAITTGLKAATVRKASAAVSNASATASRSSGNEPIAIHGECCRLVPEQPL